MQDPWFIGLDRCIQDHVSNSIKILIRQVRSIQSHGNRHQGACDGLHGQVVLLNQVHTVLE